VPKAALRPGRRSASGRGDRRRGDRWRRRRLRFAASTYERRARTRLRRFRQGSTLAVALTALLLLVAGVSEDTAGQEPAPAAPEEAAPADSSLALEEAGTTLRDLLVGFYGFLPKIALGLVILAAAWLVSRLVRAALRRTLPGWERVEAVSAVVTIAINLGAVVVSLSILAGDAAALLGSVGLIGLALSWALQTPIESFTGWFLNSLRGYYRVGDRIEVGDVFGDVYRIDVLTTTVWEAGGPGKAVAGAQPTGAMITFPNWEVLRSNVVNYSREFPYVWDELATRWPAPRKITRRCCAGPVSTSTLPKTLRCSLRRPTPGGTASCGTWSAFGTAAGSRATSSSRSRRPRWTRRTPSKSSPRIQEARFACAARGRLWT
jgi:hypothetical protein